jgi:phage terminase large subunit
MNINLEYGRVFEETYEAVQSGKYRIIINRGGTRSGKTFALAQYFISLLFTITDKPLMLSCVRKTMPVHRQGAMRDILAILQDTGLYSLVQHNKTYNTITFTQGDITNTLEFFSVEEEQKVRGPGRTHLWINEANELSFDEYRQLSLRTTGTVFIDFNPDDEEVWINKELEQDRAVRDGYQDVKVIVSSYRDNPFLSETIVKDIELLKDTDAEYWQIFGLGEYGKITGLIFTNYAICADIPQDAKLIGYGLDFGFTNDPTACAAVYMQSGELWVKEVLYEKGLTNPDIKRMLNELGVGNRDIIVADSAEPKSIEELHRMGFVFIEGARKGPDSVNASIDALKRFKINITVDSANLISEIKKYKWAMDRNGVKTGAPVDKFNHSIDALRYLALNKIQVTPIRGAILKIQRG